MTKLSRIVVFGVLLPLVFSGCVPKKAQINGSAALAAYVNDARKGFERHPTPEGSLYIENSRLSDLFRDFRARYINDVVTIRVFETTQAASSADAKNSRNTDFKAGFDKFFGAEKHINELPELVAGKSSSSFEGKGSTTRATTVQTSLTARVVDVLPNGYLVVEGVREVRVNNETQEVYLTGVVRPEDINRDNVVPSSAVAQMAVRVQGRGVVSQPLKPGWLYKILLGVMPF